MSIQRINSNTLADGAALNSVPGGVNFRNRIINGDMRIDQRNAGAAVTTSALQSNIFTLDRWSYYNDVVSKRTIQRVAEAPPGFIDSLKVTVIATDTVGPQQFLRQAIEGFNIADLGWGTAQAQPATLSFWVRSSVTGQMGGTIQNATANRSYPFAYTINSANTWEYKTVAISGETTGTWQTGNGMGVSIIFENGPGFNTRAAGAWASTNASTATGSVNLCATLNATWQITGVQLEVGTVATPFERRPFGTELVLCQRYFQKSYNLETVPGTATGSGSFALGSFAFNTTSTWGANITFQQEMRASPTVVLFNGAGTSGNLDVAFGSGSTSTAAGTTFSLGAKSVGVYHNGSLSGQTAGQAVSLGGHYTSSAEL
jgi:hypothetical protein